MLFGLLPADILLILVHADWLAAGIYRRQSYLTRTAESESTSLFTDPGWALAVVLKGLNTAYSRSMKHQVTPGMSLKPLMISVKKM